MNQICRQTLKSLASECLVGVCLGLLNILTPVCEHPEDETGTEPSKTPRRPAEPENSPPCLR